MWKPDQKAPFLSLSDLLTWLPLVLMDLRPSPVSAASANPQLVLSRMNSQLARRPQCLFFEQMNRLQLPRPSLCTLIQLVRPWGYRPVLGLPDLPLLDIPDSCLNVRMGDLKSPSSFRSRPWYIKAPLLQLNWNVGGRQLGRCIVTF